MLEAHFFKAPPGCNIAPLNHRIDSMQVIPGQCQSGETLDDRCSHSFVPIVGVADDDPNFAASVGSINVFERTVADQCLVCVHREEFVLGSGKILRISVAERSLPLLNLVEMLYQPHAQLLLYRGR
jgi:hypothetical protein